MPQTYAFQVSMEVTDALPRNRMVNRFHMEHVVGGLAATDLEGMCADIVALWQARYLSTTTVVTCSAYEVGPVPNYPLATVTAGTLPASINFPREIALVLSYSGQQAGNRRQRGRMYLNPLIASLTPAPPAARPAQTHMDWALDWYRKSNESLPDLGGVDWKFGVYSKADQKFTQTVKAWVNDDWDTVRRRSLRESARITIDREG